MPTWVVGQQVPPQSRLGTTIEGEYRVDSILGQGELGTSYQAWNPRLKRNFAILMLDRSLQPTHEMMLAVRADLKRAQALSGLGLGMMPVRQVTDGQGIPGFATELLEGETLRQRLVRGPLPVQRGLSLMVALAATLEAAHREGLIHGDLRPESVFLVRPESKGRYAGKAVLLKHSLRHLRRRPAGFDDSLPIGKLMYRPPEQVAGEVTSADVSGDIFTLGAILYEVASGVPLFSGPHVEVVLERLASPPALLLPNPAIGLTPALSEALNVVIAGSCARQPEARVPSMADLLRALQQVASGAGLQLVELVSEAAPQQPVGRLGRIIQRMSGAFAVVTRPPVERKQEPLPPPPPQTAAEAAPQGEAPPPPSPKEEAPQRSQTPLAAPAPETPSAPQAAPLPEGAKEEAQKEEAQKEEFSADASAVLEEIDVPPPAPRRPAPAPPPPPRPAQRPVSDELPTQPPRQRPQVELGEELPPSQRATVALPAMRPPVTLTARISATHSALSDRTTRPVRPPDISLLVAAVQQGRMHSAQAIELAKQPVPLSVDDRDIVSVAGVPAPSGPMHVPVYTLASQEGPRPLRRFFLQHQEAVAAGLGALTILLCGLILMWCRG